MYSCNIVLYGTRLLFCTDDSADVTWQVDWHPLNLRGVDRSFGKATKTDHSQL